MRWRRPVSDGSGAVAAAISVPDLAQASADGTKSIAALLQSVAAALNAELGAPVAARVQKWPVRSRAVAIGGCVAPEEGR